MDRLLFLRPAMTSAREYLCLDTAADRIAHSQVDKVGPMDRKAGAGCWFSGDGRHVLLAAFDDANSVGSKELSKPRFLPFFRFCFLRCADMLPPPPPQKKHKGLWTGNKPP